MKTTLLLGILLLSSAPAWADEKAACFDAAAKGQTLRDAHKLVEAREQFRRCASSTCPPAVQSDCTGWATDADKTIPTVVFSAKDADGNDALDVSVSVDGKVVSTKLDGASVPVDPGPHTFHFQWPDGTSVERQVLVPEGQRAMAVTATLAKSPAPAVPETKQAVAPGPTPRETTGAIGGTPWHTVGWIAGGVGVAGLVLGGIFTAITISDKNGGRCDSAGVCANYGSIDSAKSAAPVAGAGLIGGAAFVGLGAALLLFTNSPGEAPGAQTSGLRATPAVGPSGGALSVEGRW